MEFFGESGALSEWLQKRTRNRTLQRLLNAIPTAAVGTPDGPLRVDLRHPCHAQDSRGLPQLGEEPISNVIRRCVDVVKGEVGMEDLAHVVQRAAVFKMTRQAGDLQSQPIQVA